MQCLLAHFIRKKTGLTYQFNLRDAAMQQLCAAYALSLAIEPAVLFYAVAMNTLPSTSLFSAVVPAAFGSIGIRTDAGVVSELVYLPRSFELLEPADALSEQAAVQVARYLAEPDFRFDLPLAERGTPFQRKVWAVIAAIPRGDVLTYGEVARIIQSAPRAVGQACGANWFPLVIPCHRVLAAGGLGGFSHHDDETGFHLGVKRWLLAHEGIQGYQ